MNMREAINVTRTLLEMPGLISGSEDFGLNVKSTNSAKAKYFDSPNATVLKEFDRSTLYNLGTDDGAIGLVSKDKGLLHYYIKYESMKLSLTGKTVTQVELWRSRDVNRYVPVTITQFVFFDILLPRFGAVMSDGLQTLQGAEFWKRVLDMAELRGLTIQMADLGAATIETYEPENDLDEWLTLLNPWGTPGNPKQKRLIIRQEA